MPYANWTGICEYWWKPEITWTFTHRYTHKRCTLATGSKLIFWVISDFQTLMNKKKSNYFVTKRHMTLCVIKVCQLFPFSLFYGVCCWMISTLNTKRWTFLFMSEKVEFNNATQFKMKVYHEIQNNNKLISSSICTKCRWFVIIYVTVNVSDYRTFWFNQNEFIRSSNTILHCVSIWTTYNHFIFCLSYNIACFTANLLRQILEKGRKRKQRKRLACII